MVANGRWVLFTSIFTKSLTSGHVSSTLESSLLKMFSSPKILLSKSDQDASCVTAVVVVSTSLLAILLEKNSLFYINLSAG